MFDEVAAVNKAKAAGLKIRCAALIDTLQAASMFFKSHVRCCNWHQRQISCHTEEDDKTRKSSEQS